MASRRTYELKVLEWVGDSKRDLMAMPEQVVDVFGYALYLAQIGERHDQAKALHGFGSAGVIKDRLKAAATRAKELENE